MMIVEEENDRGGRALTAAMGRERSKPLHNFKMPCLKWSNQRLLKCMKVESDGHISSLYAADRGVSFGHEVGKGVVRRRSNCEGGRPESVGRVDLMKPIEARPSVSAAGRSSKRKSLAEDDGVHGITALKAQLIFDFQKAVEIFNDRVVNEGSEEQQVVVALPSRVEAIPWNKRKRRNEFNDFNVTGSVTGDGPRMVGGQKPNFPPLRTDNRCQEVPGKVVADTVCGNSGWRRDREKFSAVLSRKEIEEDFMALTGKKAPRRPKKRPRNVQKDLEKLFPGLWFTEVTADMYKVPEANETRKK